MLTEGQLPPGARVVLGQRVHLASVPPRHRRWRATSSRGMGLGNASLWHALCFMVAERRSGHTVRLRRQRYR